MTIGAAYPIRRIKGLRTNFENPQGSMHLTESFEVMRVAMRLSNSSARTRRFSVSCQKATRRSSKATAIVAPL